ncbi:Cytochrome [Abeliophyllum distichum]|uniref:Cytochrome n=1 Tax=Abeliophyllum distichum TaxID=126358 RepID=A0ABD1VQF3_9LAMI
MDFVAKGLDEFLEGLIEERLENGVQNPSGQDESKENFVDILLGIYKDNTTGVSIDRDGIKGIILDMFAGGTDTTSTVLEWTMSELIRHPTIMKKLQNEVRGILNGKRDITDNDLRENALFETGTMVMINAWAIGRDPAFWDEPEKFRPERFLNSSIDLKGLDFQLIPFGDGRRGCPGVAFAMATNELVLANLVQKFDWELP